MGLKTVSSPFPLLILGLNPAWQKTLVFPHFIPGEVNRARMVYRGASGKGINCARAVRHWGGESVVAQFVGGYTGRLLCEFIAGEGLAEMTVIVPGSTRTCVTCLDEARGEMTELIEPVPEVPVAARKELFSQVMDAISHSSGLALCGTWPSGIDADFYLHAARQAGKEGKPVILDAWRGIIPVLEAGVEVLKINRKELSDLAGKSGTIREQAELCLSRYRLDLLAVTDGASRAYCFSRDKGWVYELPDLGVVINPLGAGDTVTGVMLLERVRGLSWQDAFRVGLAAGTASCLRLLPADFLVADARKLATEIKLSPL